MKKTIIVIVIVIVIFLGLGFWLFQQDSSNTANFPGQAFENQGGEHIPQGSKEHAPYNSNPPTSGPHWPQEANWGIYSLPLSDEQVVHNLEHGGVWISYNSETDPQTAAKLEDFAKRYRKIIVAPRFENDAKIVFASWQHLQKFDQFDEANMVKFIEAYYNKGPEKVD
ncbi:MAG: DUF3105 domain-containing protein [Candidatus Doudnabacteria bacterium]|nr:DUF3105 domain-containing protein [Candidatus Doudnabacteria bacterium]